MYPVISLLRRAAIRVLFVDASIAEEVNGKRILDPGGKVRYVDFEEEVWTDGMKVPVFSLSVRAPSKVGAAIAMTRHENRLAKKLGLLDASYTLFLSDEVETPLDKGFLRTVRAAIISGPYVWKGKRLEKTEAARREGGPRRTASPGSVREVR